MNIKKIAIHTLLSPLYAFWFIGMLPVVFVLSIAWLYDQTQEKG